MKISNETKIGALTAIAITLLILGFNFLKGKNVLKKKDNLYTVFSKVEGLNSSDAVRINGLQVGTVSALDEKDANVSGIVVTMHITKNVNIPENSFATISSNPLGSSAINITLGSSAQYVEDGDTLSANPSSGILENLQGTLAPAVDKVNGTLKSLDSLLEVVGSMFDPKTKNNFGRIVANLTESTASLNALLNTQSGALAQSMNNLSSVTANFKKNNDTVTRIMGNLEKMTNKFANLQIDQTLTKLQAASESLNATMAKVNSGEGTLGLLLNDKKLYNNLSATSYSLNLLLQDFRLHPKRYVNVSVFGKKDKTGPLMTPLEDSATQVPDK